MAAIRYTKGDWIAEADIQPLDNGKYRGIVLITKGGTDDQSEHLVSAYSDTPVEALEEAKALAHRILADK